MQNKFPYLQVAARTQSKNENLDFNKLITTACLEAQDHLCNLRYLASYLGNANEGVLCNHIFVAEKIYDFRMEICLLLL